MQLLRHFSLPNLRGDGRRSVFRPARLLRYLSLTSLLLGLALSPALTAAHPLDALLHDLRLRLVPGRIELDGHIVVGSLVAPRIWDEADADADGAISQAEARQWGKRYLEQIRLLVDGQAIPLANSQQEVVFPERRADFLSGASASIELETTADMPPVPGGEHTLRIVGEAYAEISIYSIKARGASGLVVREATHNSAGTVEFPLIASAVVAVAATPVPEPLDDLAEGQQGPATTLAERLRGTPMEASFLAWTLLAALLFGALHALQPGHGKTLVAAYLVGSRGTVGHAIVLGGIVTFTHTASVLVLGGLLLAFSATIRLERIVPGLTLCSGLVVVALGIRLLWQRLRDASAEGDHQHHAELQHDHQHGTGSHDHQHGTGSHEQRDEAAAHVDLDHAELQHRHDHGAGQQDHHHGLPEQLTPRSLIALGISGGLVPCPEALVILIVAIASGRLALGLLMIICFSIGLASVLIGLGVLLVTLGSQLRGRMRSMEQLARWLPAASATLVILLGGALAWQALEGL